MRVVISRRAENDLAQIYAWIAIGYDIESAERFRARAENALGRLSENPSLGPHPGWGTRHKQLRFWVISRSNYHIYYEVREAEISIERVLDGRRDVHRIIETGVEHPPYEET